jgi:phospholipid-transporting ATPase
MVRMVMKRFGKLGLAVGDGMNDVSMIQEARVGVGILGKEGSQASRSADYSIPSFRHLRRLVAVYGRYSLLRTAQFVQYSFYKNTTLVFTQIFFGFWTLYTGQTIIDSFVLTFYNLIFTLLPPFLFGLFEKDIDEETIERHPEIYQEFTSVSIIDYRSFGIWMLQALYHASVIFFFMYAIQFHSDAHLAYHGFKSDDLWLWCGQFGLIVHFVVTLKAAITMRYWPVFTTFIMILSFFLCPIFYAIYSAINVPGQTYMYYIGYILFTSPKFYLTAFLCIVTCLAPDLALMYARKFFIPAKWELLQLKVRKEERNARFYLPWY